MHVKALAKINLCLEVLGRRSDGYHEVSTVLHSIDLNDSLAFDLSDGVEISCLPPLADESDNLVAKAAALLKQRYDCLQGVRVHIVKGIPVAAGLGGGSSGAAATLRVLNELWRLGLGTGELERLGSELGSDVPFFVRGGCAFAGGKGEILVRLPALHRWWAVVAQPPFYIEDKTRRLYGLLENRHFTDGSATREIVERVREGSLAVEQVAQAPNVFEEVMERAFPGIISLQRAFVRAGAPFGKLAGSGPSLFTLVDEEGRGRAIKRSLGEQGIKAWLASLRALHKG